MPFCPACSYEYDASVSVCPDCGEKLVAELPERRQAVAQPVDDSWRPICGVQPGLKTQMAKGALDTGNIPSTVLSSNHLGNGLRHLALDATFGDWGGEPNVILVPREFSDDAELLLRGVLGEDFVELE
jgi:hypothetical protein